eukprot:12473934-Alexandrium_andersonii.AAC.1
MTSRASGPDPSSPEPPYSRASGTHVEAVSGPAQFQVRTPAAISACSMYAGAARLDRFDSLL